MAVRQFALPLDSSSKQTGDITFKQLKDNGTVVKFELTNVSNSPGVSCTLNLITKKGGATTSHIYNASIVSGTAGVSVSAGDISTIYSAAAGGDWDYVEAQWAVGATDDPTTSIMQMIQDDRYYDYVGWPPNPED